MPAGRRRKCGHGGVAGGPVGTAGIDAAEQRLDKPVHALAPQSSGHVGANRDVLIETGPWQDVVERQPRSRGPRQQPAAADRRDSGGNPHDLINGNGMELTPRPERRRRGVGVDDLVPEPDRLDEIERLRPACEQRLSPYVDPDAANLTEPQLPADGRRTLQVRHARASDTFGLAQVVGGSYPCDAAADHGDMATPIPCSHTDTMPDRDATATTQVPDRPISTASTYTRESL